MPAPANKPAKPKKAGSMPAVDSRGNVRVYADVPADVAEGLAILSIKARKPKKDFLAELIKAAVTAAK